MEKKLYVTPSLKVVTLTQRFQLLTVSGSTPSGSRVFRGTLNSYTAPASDKSEGTEKEDWD